MPLPRWRNWLLPLLPPACQVRAAMASMAAGERICHEANAKMSSGAILRNGAPAPSPVGGEIKFELPARTATPARHQRQRDKVDVRLASVLRARHSAAVAVRRPAGRVQGRCVHRRPRKAVWPQGTAPSGVRLIRVADLEHGISAAHTSRGGAGGDASRAPCPRPAVPRRTCPAGPLSPYPRVPRRCHRPAASSRALTRAPSVSEQDRHNLRAALVRYRCARQSLISPFAESGLLGLGRSAMGPGPTSGCQKRARCAHDGRDRPLGGCNRRCDGVGCQARDRSLQRCRKS